MTPWCWPSPELLCDMLYNLIQNARKATPADGKVEVLLDETPTRLTIRVQDTGLRHSAAGTGPHYRAVLYGR